jgi:anti-sigma regulatory factor (Ser/Thr protein kinase)
MIGSVFSPPVVAQSIEVQLVALPNAVGLARRLVSEWFRHWQAPEHVIEGGELVASELVTNAVKAKGKTIRMRIRWGNGSGYIEVWDGDPNPPIEKEAGEADTGGRGLFLVGAYATRWNYYPADTGKVVWAELRATHIPA